MDSKLSKSYLLEGQIMHEIKKKQEHLNEIKAMRNKNPPDISDADYLAAFYSCNGAIDSLMICLSCHDNVLSNFLKPDIK